MGNYTIFEMFENPREGRQAAKKFYNKCSENSRSQIVFRTDIFQKLSLGAPDVYQNQLNKLTRVEKLRPLKSQPMFLKLSKQNSANHLTFLTEFSVFSCHVSGKHKYSKDH